MQMLCKIIVCAWIHIEFEEIIHMPIENYFNGNAKNFPWKGFIFKYVGLINQLIPHINSIVAYSG